MAAVNYSRSFSTFIADFFFLFFLYIYIYIFKWTLANFQRALQSQAGHWPTKTLESQLDANLLVISCGVFKRFH